MVLTSNTRKPIKKSAEEKEDFESLVQHDLSKLKARGKKKLHYTLTGYYTE